MKILVFNLLKNMKILSTISLFIFGIVLTSILTSGLVFYQNNKSNQVLNNQTGSLVSDTITKLTSSGKSVILNMAEISKHNNQNNCWIIISGKVYDITSYFGSHPGGNSTMAPTCGTDATAAYATRDPYAKTSGSSVAHSSNASNMLKDYYLGDFNQTITNSGVKTNPVVSQVNNQVSDIKTPVNNTVSNTVINPVLPASGNLTLNISEISKHNKSIDCWILISGKVYNITSFFGSHPGGNSVMAATCGTDATAAYMTKDPNATSTAGGRNHSSNAVSMLASYFIGNLNQVIGQQNITKTNAVIAPTTKGSNDEYDD